MCVEVRNSVRGRNRRCVASCGDLKGCCGQQDKIDDKPAVYFYENGIVFHSLRLRDLDGGFSERGARHR